MNNHSFDPKRSLQDQFAPHNACFGCGPANEKGLRIKSYLQGDELVATWQPKPEHEGFPGFLNGGIIGALLDCHSNWTAAFFLMKRSHAQSLPCTVTAFFNVSLKQPTPTNKGVTLRAKVKELKENKALIYAELYSNNQLCATCEGLFVKVKEDHPAFNRW